MAKHLIDSDVYIDFLQSGKFHAEIARIYIERTPSIYFSSVVIEELLAGAISPAERRNVETLYLPFERARRIVTPTHANWKETGDLLARIFRGQSSYRSKLPHIVADCLIAMLRLSLFSSQSIKKTGQGASDAMIHNAFFNCHADSFTLCLCPEQMPKLLNFVRV